MADNPKFGQPIVYDDEELQKMMQQDAAVAEWMKKMATDELERIKKAGANAIIVPIKNTGIIREGKKVLNRVEADTNVDFAKVRQIMLSDPVPCPLKANYNYCNVLLFTTTQTPYLLPYLYDKTINNDLSEWIFINAKGSRARHRVEGFSPV